MNFEHHTLYNISQISIDMTKHWACFARQLHAMHMHHDNHPFQSRAVAHPLLCMHEQYEKNNGPFRLRYVGQLSTSHTVKSFSAQFTHEKVLSITLRCMNSHMLKPVG